MKAKQSRSYSELPPAVLETCGQALVAVLRKHIPGNPAIVIEYMPGGGGRKAANHMFKHARPDGLTIGAMLAAFVPTAFRDVGVLYDLDKMIYLGAIQSGVSHVFLRAKEQGSIFWTSCARPQAYGSEPLRWGTSHIPAVASSRIFSV
jgi:hypothetical protein